MSYGIRRGIVEEIVSSTEYRVRIINYDSGISDPTKTVTSDLAIASVMVQPGTSVSYNEGDRVYLAFNKDELSDPVIIGSMLTESYLTEDSQISIPQVDSEIEKIKESISDLNVDQYYTHVKYSNDGGITFTSLYEYTEVDKKLIGQNYYIVAEDIEINPTSESVYWSIVDKDGIDGSYKFTIDTKIKAGNILEDGSFEEKESKNFTDKIFEIPFSMRTYDSLFLDFTITYINEYEDYHFVLTTDKNIIGSTQGDYMGICITVDSEPPDDPSYYSWTSFESTIKSSIQTMKDDIEERVLQLEHTTYGNETNEIFKIPGIVDGILVSSDRVDVHGEDNKDVVFNTNKSMFIDNEENNFTTQSIKHTINNSNTSFVDTFNSNGHLTLYVRENE